MGCTSSKAEEEELKVAYTRAKPIHCRRPTIDRTSHRATARRIPVTHCRRTAGLLSLPPAFLSLLLQVSLLSSSPFFLHLTTLQLRDFALCFDLLEASPGDRILTQGEPGDTFLVLGAGEADITCTDASTGDEIFLCSKKSGDSFGEQCVLADGMRRTASVTATSECTLLVLTRAALLAYLDTLDRAAQLRLNGLIGTKMIDSLRQIDFLQGVDDFKLGLLANVFQYVTVEAGATVFEEGDRGRDFYVISDGKVRVSAKAARPVHSHASSPHSPSSTRGSFVAASANAAAEAASSTSVVAADSEPQDLQFATLDSGSYFGELALLVALPRTATVRALTRCLLLVINVSDFDNFIAIVPGLRDRFNRVASSRIAQQFSKFSVPFFQSIPQTRFKALADLCALSSLPKDTVVVAEGDVPGPDEPAFYLVVSGRLAAHKDGMGVVGTLEPPSYFGEISLVTDSARTATIVADTDCVLLSITKSGFRDFFMGDGGDGDGAAAQQYAEFSIKLSQHQTPLRPVLQHSLGRDLFAQQLAAEYSSENLLFYDAVAAFELLRADSQRAELARRAAQIVRQFVAPSADQQVNLPDDCARKCLAEHAAGRVHPQLFADCKMEIYKLLEADSFKRFKSSPLFQRLLSTIGSYESKAQEHQHHRLSVAYASGGQSQLRPLDTATVHVAVTRSAPTSPLHVR